MTNALRYKLVLLGCVSSCLMSAAYANSEDLVTLALTGPGPYEPELRDIACETKPVIYTFTLTNEDDDRAPVSGIFIKTDRGDDFRRFGGLIKVLPPQTTNDCGYGSHHDNDAFPNPRFHFDLPANGGHCNINVLVNPESVDCGDNDTLPTTGEIKRDLVVLLETYQRAAVFELDDIEMTLIGSLDSFSLVGTRLCTNGDEAQCDPDFSLAQNHPWPWPPVPPMPPTPSDEVLVPQDIALLDENTYISDNIKTLENIYRDDDAVAEAAGNDLLKVYHTLKKLGDPEVSAQSCNFLPSNLNGDLHDPEPVIIRGGVQCFIGDTPVTVAGPVTFDAKGSQIVLIVDGTGDADDMALTIVDSGYFQFAEGTDFSDVTWVVTGQTEVQSINRTPADGTYNFAGDLITNGGFEMDAPDCGRDQNDSEVECIPAIAGGIYTLDREEWESDDNQDVRGGEITLSNGTVFADTDCLKK